MDLETGRRMGLPQAPGEEPSLEAIENATKWARRSEADFGISYVSGKICLWGLKMRLAPAGDVKWEEITTDSVHKGLQEKILEDRVLAKPKIEELPRRYYFSTMSGTFGVIEVVSGTERQAQLRYMLMKRPATMPATRP